MPPPERGRGRGRNRTELHPSSPIKDDDQLESGFGSVSSSTESFTSPTTSVSIGYGRGRGRGSLVKRNVVPDDLHWTVTDLTPNDFNSTVRPKKPDELGTLGQHIQVMANYFPILQFPHKGLVYRYQIQMQNRKNREVHRDRRRYTQLSFSFSINSYYY
jgi:hypothetical protein